MNERNVAIVACAVICNAVLLDSPKLLAQTPVGDSLSETVSSQGLYISWQEHIIDDAASAGFALSGGDGLVMGDIDKDGFEDIVSVHESDAEYDSAVYNAGFVPEPAGHVRIAFGSGDPNGWVNITVADGNDSPAPEDASVADVNGDGYLDIIVAAELSHLIYLQNPGNSADSGDSQHIRSREWPRLILPMTKDRGSYIRVFFADFNGDGIPEVVAANKGSQTPGPEDYKKKTPVMVYQVVGNPLDDNGWSELELGRFVIPQNSEPVDIDGDGDLDIIVGSRGENRLVLFENTGDRYSDRGLHFEERAIAIEGAQLAGFNLDYTDLNNDGRLDIIGAGGRSLRDLMWIEQPQSLNEQWKAHHIGTVSPDIIVGLGIADIDGDGNIDVITGGYSSGSRTGDGDISVDDSLGRISWFQNPGNAAADWVRHDISRRKRGMFDKFIGRDRDGDGDIDFIATRGNSAPFDGVFWIEQVRSEKPMTVFKAARVNESQEMPLP